MLKLAMVFNDKMVLQREKFIPVWGESDPGAEVSVSFDGGTVRGSADEEGHWMVCLPAHEAGINYEMRVKAGQEEICLKDVCVGEVWLAGGQSNMEYLLGFEQHIDEVLKKERNPLIRFFDYPEVSYEGQMEDFSYKHEGFWRGCTEEDLPYFSAVGYYFAAEIQKSLQVPVGILGCNWGGTPACAWMDPERLRGTKGEFWLTDYEEAVKGLDVEKYKEAFRKNPMNDRTRQLEDPENVKVMKVGLTREEQLAVLQMNGQDGGGFAPEIGPFYERRPGGLYETMLKKVVPFAVRGAIWYQGETDSDKNPEAYRTVFGSMIENWRELWGEDFPFLFVQLAPFRAWLDCVGTAYPVIRECQERVSREVPGTWMASIGDVGMEWDIHPKNKKPVGERLALLARGHVYGEEILCDAPECRGAQKSGGRITVFFAHGEGLHLEGEKKLQAMYGKTAEGELRELCEAQIAGDTLVLEGCEDVEELRFASSDYYEVNLFNAAGIPVKPFVWKAE